MNQIQFDCPGCGQTIETPEDAYFEQVKCPTCQHEFFPGKTRFVQPASATPPPESASPAPPPPTVPPAKTGGWKIEVVDSANTAPDLESRREKIRRNASMLSAIGGFFAVIGLLVGVFSIIAMKSGDDATEGFITSAAMIGMGLWFYLVGQVVHIRANTEK
jgi:endogenous inhibitor of DNA gyrase (YacG/DUF329 family)